MLKLKLPGRRKSRENNKQARIVWPGCSGRNSRDLSTIACPNRLRFFELHRIDIKGPRVIRD